MKLGSPFLPQCKQKDNKTPQGPEVFVCIWRLRHSSVWGYYKADGSTVAQWSFTGDGTVQLCRTSRLSKMERGFSNAEVTVCQIKTFGAQIMIGIM